MSLRFDTKGVEQVGPQLAAAAKAAETAAYRTVNQVASKFFTRSRREITSRVMLSAKYVGERMWLSKASQGDAEAVIYARRRSTRLATYGYKVLTKAAKDKQRSKGDSLRKVSAGRKVAGVSIKVIRGGSRKTLPGAFMIPLLASKYAGGNGMGIFIREGSQGHAESIMTPKFLIGKNRWKKGTPLNAFKSGFTGSKGVLRHLYGPSVDQVFKSVIPEMKPDLQAELADVYVKKLKYELSRINKG